MERTALTNEEQQSLQAAIAGVLELNGVAEEILYSRHNSKLYRLAKKLYCSSSNKDELLAVDSDRQAFKQGHRDYYYHCEFIPKRQRDAQSVMEYSLGYIEAELVIKDRKEY